MAGAAGVRERGVSEGRREGWRKGRAQSEMRAECCRQMPILHAHRSPQGLAGPSLALCGLGGMVKTAPIPQGKPNRRGSPYVRVGSESSSWRLLAPFVCPGLC